MVLFEPNIMKAGIECYHSVQELPESKIIHVVIGNKTGGENLEKGKKVRYLAKLIRTNA